MLKEIFIKLLSQYTIDQDLIDRTWKDIEKAYTAESRYYHNLTHLNHMLQELSMVKQRIFHWNSVVFALYYHDYIYNPLKKDNEEKSAEYAIQQLKKFNADLELIELTTDLILATKSHDDASKNDTSYFVDSDLSVLGADWSVYLQYAQNIRNEYSAYPDEIYTSGRQNVLNHFLEMKRIFKTEEFHTRLEANARSNMRKEFEMLLTF